jgi:4-amino-4-deoxy-L-arabinose transferase-like glycosyltransferase
MLAKNSSLKILSLIILIAFFLSTINLSYKQFGVDEKATLEDIKQEFQGFMYSVSFIEANPPLYFFLAWLLFQTTKSFFAVRLLSVIAFIASIVLIYFLLKEKNIELALLSSTLFAFSPLALMYAQHARLYMFLAFLSLCFLFLLKKLKENFSKKKALLFLFVSSMLLLSSYVSIFIVIAALLLELKEKQKKQAILIIASIAVFIFWLLFNLQSFFYSSTKPGFGEKSIIGIAYIFLKFVLGANIHFIQNISIFLFFICLIILVFALIGFIFLLIEKEKNALIFLLTFLLMFFFSLTGKNLLIARYLFFLFPLFIIFIAKGLNQLKNNLIKKAIFLLMLSFFFLIDFLYLIATADILWPTNFGL